MYDRYVVLRLFVLAITLSLANGWFTIQAPSWLQPSSSADKLSKVRANFRKLLEVNPNYFGNSPDSAQSPVFPLVWDTYYEQLISVGYNAVLNLLEATIAIKQSDGYYGSPCTNGSFEYVHFYVDYGSGWVDIGVSAANVYDVPYGLDCSSDFNHPLSFVASLPFFPAQGNCSNPLLPNIRAILSWDAIPPNNSPDWNPVWGNVLDQHIQPPPVNTLTSTLKDLVKQHKHPRPPPKAHCNNRNPTPVQETFETFIPRPPPFDTTYERLIGLGLDSQERLVATIRIEQPYGYGSGLCQDGSLEYISFWADWDNTCQWTYLDTLTINVHNITDIPRHGLTYSAVLPLDLRSVCRNCTNPQVAQVRAALAWDAQPPEPPLNPVRGNWLQTHVLVPPCTNVTNNTIGVISTIGSVPISQIDTQNTGLTFSGASTWWGAPLDGYSRQCPFGWYNQGLPNNGIFVTGPTPLSGDYAYRIVYQPSPPPPPPSTYPLPVLNPIYLPPVPPVPIPVPPPTAYYPDGNGWFDYFSIEQNPGSILGRWMPPPPPPGTTWQIRLEVSLQGSVHNTLGSTEWYNVSVNVPNPDGDVEFTSLTLCGNFTVDQPIAGTVWANTVSGLFFDSYSLTISPGYLGNPTVTPSNPAIDPIPSTDPSTWSVSSIDGTPCGYVVQLRVTDLTWMDSGFSPRDTWGVDRGFCLQE